MIETRLTRAFGLTHPVLSAPMAKAGGGALAAAVTRAGGLGLIGGGYGEADWIAEQVAAAGNTCVGIGFITWRLDGAPELLEDALARDPRALFLSFGDPVPYGERIRAAGVPLICQCQTLADVARAVEARATAIVAQGGEAGGHGADRATMTLVPEVADWLAVRAPDTLLLAAGGIVDGRGLAAALMLGADGVVCGTRFWASAEALLPPGHGAAALAATGDDTVKTRVLDIARGFDWPERFRIRALRTPFTDRWDTDPEGLRRNDAARADWQAALGQGRVDVASATVGEGVGIIRDLPPAATVLERMVAEAEALLNGGWRR